MNEMGMYGIGIHVSYAFLLDIFSVQAGQEEQLAETE